MNSRSTSGINTIPRTVSSTTPATSNHQNKHENAPLRSATQQPESTRDFYIDTFFNPVWMSGPHVFTFAENGTIVRPQTYAPEPYPGYYADRPRRPIEFAIDASYSHGFVRQDPGPWTITEQNNAEFAAFQERMRIGGVGEWGRHSPYYSLSGSSEPSPRPQEPELVYTWPPKPGAW